MADQFRAATVMVPDPGSPLSADLAGILASVCRRWFAGGGAVRPLAQGGFSGAAVSLVEAGGERHVLKAFPAGTTRDRAQWVHSHLRRARVAGVVEVPAIRLLADGESVVEAEGRLWEMTAFVDGVATDRASADQVMAAARVLGRLHQTAARLADRGESPAIAQRIEGAKRLLARPWSQLLETAASGPSSATRSIILPRLATAAEASESGLRRWILPAIASLEPLVVARQWVVRDVWSEHVLFSRANSQHVAGIIDFHAAGIDTPATDLARLLGSWLDADSIPFPTWWSEGIASYETIAPLSVSERELVPFLAASGIVFGLDNWFRWTLEEDRQFASTAEVAARLDRLVRTLQPALGMLGRWAAERV